MLFRALYTKTATMTNARSLRRATTKPEDILWKMLRSRRFRGYKFRRQVPLGPFIADFFCAEKRLIIEIDGDSHAEQVLYDRERSVYLSEHGLTVLRFWNHVIYQDLDGVLERIAEALTGDDDPSP